MPIILLEATIPISSLIYLILGISGTVALVALAVVLFKAASALTGINKLVRDISPDIEETVSHLPAVTENIEIISGNLVDMTDDLADSLPEVLEDLETVTGAIGDTVDALSSVISAISGALSSLFGARKRKGTEGKSTVQEILTVGGAVLSLIRKGKEKEKARQKQKNREKKKN